MPSFFAARHSWRDLATRVQRSPRVTTSQSSPSPHWICWISVSTAKLFDLATVSEMIQLCSAPTIARCFLPDRKRAGAGARMAERFAKNERKIIGEDIMTVQFRWPLGMPLVDHLGS